VPQGEAPAELVHLVHAGDGLQHEDALGSRRRPDAEQRGRVPGLRRACVGLVPLVQSEVGEVAVEVDLQAGHLGGLLVRDLDRRRLAGLGEGQGQARVPQAAAPAEAIVTDRERLGWCQALPAPVPGLFHDERGLVAGDRLHGDRRPQRPLPQPNAGRPRLFERLRPLPFVQVQRAPMPAQAVVGGGDGDGGHAQRHEGGRTIAACPQEDREHHEPGEHEAQDDAGEVELIEAGRGVDGHRQRPGGDGQTRGRGQELHETPVPRSTPASPASARSRRMGNPATFEGEPVTDSTNHAPRPSM
jgi:hypothetical protein